MSWLDVFDTWGKLLVFTVGLAYHALIFGVVVTLASLVIHWRFFVWVMAARRVDGRGSSRSSAAGARKPVTIQDLIGIDEAKSAVMEIVDFLRAPARYRAMGCEMPRGILLVGSPGVGKTTLARAIATEAGVPFIGTDAATLDEIFFGIGALRIRSLFKRCRKLAAKSRHRAAVLFVDEIDAIGSRNRGMTSVSGATSGNTTLNRLLTEMDGLDSTTNIVVIAATNYDESLDPALLRPGRFDRKLYVPLPNLAARKRLFAHYLGRVKARSGINLDTLAEMTVNFSGADVKAAVNEAALLSVRVRATEITQAHLESAVQLVSEQAGDRRPVGGGIAHARAGDLTVRLDHVVGADEAKRDARQIIDLLRNASKLQETGAKMTRGLLLLGPPGTGKTMIAKAIANEAGVPFYSVSGADFVELFVGMGAHRVRSIYSQARKHKAAIVFIDELDALGARTSTETGGGVADREYNQTINQLLVELDGFGRSGVLTIAATNFEESLDTALLRPGRFDRRIYVPMPDEAAREALLRQYLGRVKHEPDVDVADLVQATASFSGADIAHMVNAGALLALQEGRTSTTSADLVTAASLERSALSSRTVGSSAIVSRITDITVRLDDVVGIEDAKREVVEVVELLRAPGRAADLGIKPPRGLLFAGPPGTGKTMLAQAMANEAGVPFYAVAGSDFASMWRGEPSRRIRAVYGQARRHPAAVVFIDEIDALAAPRSTGPGTLRDDNATVDALLVEMDGFGGSSVLTIAATNSTDLLDPAVLRPGRFDRIIPFSLPDVGGRRRVLERHLSAVKTDGVPDLDAVARASAGCSPADLMNVVKEAGMLALRAGRVAVSAADLAGGLERVAVGRERRVVMSGHERQVAAYHEAGHALAMQLLAPGRQLRKVSIVGTSDGALGFTWGVPGVEVHMRSERDYLAEVQIILAGFAAERLVFGVATDGASGDLQKVAQLVKRMVSELGMGGVLYRAEPLSEALREHLDREMRRITDSCFQQVTGLLTANRPRLDRVASALLAREALSVDDLAGLALA
jgi:ATP-dependent metalloprotease FtsH